MNRLKANRRCFECGEKGHYARKCPKKRTPQIAHSLVAGLSSEMKRTLYEMLLYDKENPIADDGDEAESPTEESNAGEEDFTNGE